MAKIKGPGLPKVHEDGKIKSHFSIPVGVYRALRKIAEADRRTMTDEISWLIMERKRELDREG